MESDNQINCENRKNVTFAWTAYGAVVDVLVPVSYTHLDVYKRQP